MLACPCPAQFDTQAPKTWGRWVDSLENFMAAADLVYIYYEEFRGVLNVNLNLIRYVG